MTVISNNVWDTRWRVLCCFQRILLKWKKKLSMHFLESRILKSFKFHSYSFGTNLRYYHKIFCKHVDLIKPLLLYFINFIQAYNLYDNNNPLIFTNKYPLNPTNRCPLLNFQLQFYGNINEKHWFAYLLQFQSTYILNCWPN